jgi:hypothetical protein
MEHTTPTDAIESGDRIVANDSAEMVRSGLLGTVKGILPEQGEAKYGVVEFESGDTKTLALPLLTPASEYDGHLLIDAARDHATRVETGCDKCPVCEATTRHVGSHRYIEGFEVCAGCDKEFAP